MTCLPSSIMECWLQSLCLSFSGYTAIGGLGVFYLLLRNQIQGLPSELRLCSLANRGWAFLLLLYSPAFSLQRTIGWPLSPSPLCLPLQVPKSLIVIMGKYLFFSTWQLRVGSSVETKLQNAFSVPSPTGPPTQLLNLASVGRLHDTKWALNVF